MTHSMIALAAAVGCLQADQQKAPLLSVQRIFVDRLSGESSTQIRDMIINALEATKLFILTENPERADATLRGSAEDLIYTETFQASEGISARAAVGSGSTSSGAGTTRRPGFSAGIGQDESVRKAERKHEAAAAVRLVTRDGDVIWSTTQESSGAKFRGAAADLAEKVVRQLVADLEKARRAAESKPEATR